jgi:urease accessory protein
LSRLGPSDCGGPGRGLALLRLLQVFDSQFPIGAFAHSGGIETYAALGGGPVEVRQILQAQIALGWGRSELGAACLAWHAAGDVHDPAALSRLARRIDVWKVVPAVRDTSARLGRRALELLRRLYPDMSLEVTPTHHALVIGAAGRRLGVDVEDLLPAYAHSLAIGTLAAAIRCMPVSPAQAQELLIESHSALIAAAGRALADPDGSLFTCTPALDIRSHQQAFLPTRLFQS